MYAPTVATLSATEYVILHSSLHLMKRSTRLVSQGQQHAIVDDQGGGGARQHDQLGSGPLSPDAPRFLIDGPFVPHIGSWEPWPPDLNS